MFDSILKDVKYQFRFGDNTTKLILANVAVFIAIYLVFIIVALSSGADYRLGQEKVLNYLMLPNEGWTLLKRPWTVISYMFLHRGLFHILWNMLILFWIGRLFGTLMGDRRIIPLYILGGLMGAVFIFLATFTNFPMTPAMGATASVMAIVVATTIIAPNHTINLILVGPVALKWITLALIVLDLVGIASLKHSGSYFAHIGGMLMGWIFIKCIQNDMDPTDWFDRIGQFFSRQQQASKKKSNLKIRHSKLAQMKQQETKDQNRLDQILDKISKSGIKSLTSEEREYLDKASKKE